MAKLLLAFLLAWSAGSAGAAFDYAKYRKLTESILKVEAANTDGSVSLGTGVVVAAGIVATNCHVTRRARSVQLIKGGLRVAVADQQADVDRDLCLLRAPLDEGVPVADLSGERLRTGQPVYAVGYVLGLAPQLNAGEVKALYDYDRGRIIQTSTPFTSGASGGGLFDQDGRLVGIVTFRSQGVPHHFSLPIQWVREALYGFWGRPVRPEQGVPFWGRSAETRPYFLTAARLESEGLWMELVELARAWSSAESTNPSPWFMLGKAYYALRDHTGSIEAEKVAVSLDPANAEAWYALGLAYAARGEQAELRRVQRELARLDARLAGELTSRGDDCARTRKAVC